MKLSVPHYAVGPVMHALHDSSVGAVLMERTGPGWIVELATELDDATVTRIVRLGAEILPP